MHVIKKIKNKPPVEHRVDLLKSKIVKFTCVVLQVHDVGEYPLEIDETPNAIELFINPFF